MGILSGTIPRYTMMSLSRRTPLLQMADDTWCVFHTHAVAGILGDLSSLLLIVPNSKGAFYGGDGGVQFPRQLVRESFIIGWNVVATSIILLVIRVFIPLRMTDEELKFGDDEAHGEAAYAHVGKGQRERSTVNGMSRHDIENQESKGTNFHAKRTKMEIGGPSQRTRGKTKGDASSTKKTIILISNSVKTRISLSSSLVPSRMAPSTAATYKIKQR
ncbi:Ammonium transporter AmtB-like domain, partial [Dillenia turbinata]